MSERELRTYSAELRASKTGDAFVIEGRAMKYDSLSNRNVPMAGCREQFAPGAFGASVSDPEQDIFALMGHDPNQVLARRSNGSLKITDGPDALEFQIRLNPNIVAHRDIHEAVKSGLLREMSVGFAPQKDAWSNATDERGAYQLRTITKAKLFEISLVASPAYGDGVTSASARSQKEVGDENTSDLREQFEKVRLF